MTVEADYKKRLFAQFANSPNIQALIEILSTPMQDTTDAVNFLLDHSSIDDADGEQLEKLGAKIGIVRPRKQETDLFTLCRAGEVVAPAKGFTVGALLGGFLPTAQGLEDQRDSTAMMSDPDFRKLIRQKAKSYRSKATREILFSYLLAAGSQCKIDDDDSFDIYFDPVRWADLNLWFMNYIETRGFKPATNKVVFIGPLRHGDSI